MFAVSGSSLDAEKTTFAQLGVGGALLQSPPADLSANTVQGFRDAGAIPMLIAVDEEGGTVQRLQAQFGAIPSESDVVNTMTPEQAEVMIANHAREVAGLGVNVVFAPVVDVRPVGREGVIGSRSPSDDPNVVARYGRAYVDGWESAGILPVLKHFPGHGSASGDTHAGSAVVPPLSELRRRDLVPYFDLARNSAKTGVMVAHVEVPGFTTGPASLSPAAYALLRNDVGFRGVAFTDALDMDAVARNYTEAQAAVAAIGAGADVALLENPSETRAVIDAVTDAIGTAIPESSANASVLRVLSVKKIDPCSLPG
jgi:beta-N-acetylhexosaminidase